MQRNPNYTYNAPTPAVEEDEASNFEQPIEEPVEEEETVNADPAFQKVGPNEIKREFPWKLAIALSVAVIGYVVYLAITNNKGVENGVRGAVGRVARHFPASDAAPSIKSSYAKPARIPHRAPNRIGGAGRLSASAAGDGIASTVRGLGDEVFGNI